MSPISNPSSPSPRPFGLHRSWRYLCIVVPCRRGCPPSPGPPAWPGPKGSEDLTPVGHHKRSDSWGNAGSCVAKCYIEILDVIGLSVIRVTFPPKRLSIVDSCIVKTWSFEDTIPKKGSTTVVSGNNHLLFYLQTSTVQHHSTKFPVCNQLCHLQISCEAMTFGDFLPQQWTSPVLRHLGPRGPKGHTCLPGQKERRTNATEKPGE